ncbi:MAG: hypothetical protein KAJ14_11690 [Candidatus Omnitrophica bacterium]|nr:hypothetical protein [Candidatus Omnitrophota bacterium]MCK5393341.1 hypothetical protein [Candidatus Omnitrophota bacterium]MCK5493761.1 hypothetical protein [Candidatus Omnitrophota bacterium]
MTKILNVIILMLMVSVIVYSQDKETRNPFEDLFPKRIVEEIKMEESNNDEMSEMTLPEFDIQGILWGTDKPQTIIEGKVYNIGDKIENMDLKILKIEDNNVFFLYGEKVFEKEIGKMEAK